MKLTHITRACTQALQPREALRSLFILMAKKAFLSAIKMQIIQYKRGQKERDNFLW